MSRALWTPHAEQELDEILYHISVRDRRPMTGELVYYEIRQLADQYAEPNAARHKHPLAPAGWFYFLHKRWLVFYKLHLDGIEVMRVIDGTRDLPAMLS
jgi:plasmid stabilization system protein ParE